MKKQLLYLVCAMTVVLSQGNSFANTATVEEYDIEYETTRQPEMITEDFSNASQSVIEKALSKNKQQQTQKEEEVASLDNDIEKSVIRLDEIRSRKNEATSSYFDSKKLLDENKKKLEKMKEVAHSRMRFMYQMQNYTFIDLVFNAEGFMGFIYDFAALQFILSNDVDIIEKYKKMEQEFAKDRLKAEAIFIRMSNLEDEEISESEHNKQLRAQKLAVLDGLKKQEGELIKIRNDQQFEMNGTVLTMQTDVTDDMIAYPATERYIWPTNRYTISSGFEYRVDPLNGVTDFHGGIDIPNIEGAPIYAADNGVVILSGYVKGYGNTVVIYHGKGISTLYGHIRHGGIKVKVGQQIKAGEIIAEVGSTGRSTGNHVHFEYLVNGQKQNPLNIVKRPSDN